MVCRTCSTSTCGSGVVIIGCLKGSLDWISESLIKITQKNKEREYRLDRNSFFKNGYLRVS